MKTIRWLQFWCCALLMAGGTTAAWAGPSLVQCNGIKDLVFVPHQDDDLLFMNPDIESSIDAGGCVQLVYLTASERGEGEGYMLGRERGVQAAYSYIAHVPDIWTESVSTFGARHLVRFTLNAEPRISLLNMRLEDPWLGKGWGSLTPLSKAESVPGQTAKSLGPYVESYTRPELVATIAAIIGDYQPTSVRHMDDTITVPYTALCWRCAGHDHPDHIASARLVHDAIKMAQGNYAEVAYVDYPSQERDANLTQAETAEKSDAFRRYAWNDYRYCVNADLCKEPAGPAASWVGRIYYVSRRDAPSVLLPGPRGGYSLFTVGEHSRAANVWQSGAQQWASLGGRTADHIVAFDLEDGRAGIFARDATGHLWVNTQDKKDAWHGWQMVAGTRLTRLPTVTSQGRPAAVAMGNDGEFHYSAQMGSGGEWSSWIALAPLAQALSTAAIARDGHGGLVVFAADLAGKLWSSTLAPFAPADSTSRPSWTAWKVLGAVKTNGGLAAMRNAHGLIELYARDAHTGHMLRMVQSSPSRADINWSAPIDLGFSYTGQPAIGLNEHGDVTVAALEHNGGPLWLVDEGQAQLLPGTAASTPTLKTINGSLYVVARSAEQAQDYWLMVRSAGAWATPLLIKAPPGNGGGAFKSTTSASLPPLVSVVTRPSTLACDSVDASEFHNPDPAVDPVHTPDCL